jgi:hypothetical protein
MDAEKGTLLMLDIDGGKAALDKALFRIRLTNKVLEGSFKRSVVYKTTHGWHIYVEGVSRSFAWHAFEILLIQCFLGSDWMRELYNYKRLVNGQSKNWNVLFREKFDLNGKVKSRERFYCNIRYGGKKT